MKTGNELWLRFLKKNPLMLQRRSLNAFIDGNVLRLSLQRTGISYLASAAINLLSPTLLPRENIQLQLGSGGQTWAHGWTLWPEEGLPIQGGTQRGYRGVSTPFCCEVPGWAGRSSRHCKGRDGWAMGMRYRETERWTQTPSDAGQGKPSCSTESPW